MSAEMLRPATTLADLVRQAEAADEASCRTIAHRLRDLAGVNGDWTVRVRGPKITVQRHPPVVEEKRGPMKP